MSDLARPDPAIYVCTSLATCVRLNVLTSARSRTRAVSQVLMVSSTVGVPVRLASTLWQVLPIELRSCRALISDMFAAARS